MAGVRAELPSIMCVVKCSMQDCWPKVFDCYNIIDERDLAAAIERASAYVETLPTPITGR